MSNLKLEVGKLYWTTFYSPILISRKLDNSNIEDAKNIETGYTFVDAGNNVYTSDGRFDVEEKETPFDLIAEVGVQDDVFHPEIGFDDHVLESIQNQDTPVIINPHIGPHNHRELNLMVAGFKPCAIVDLEDFEKVWAEAIQKHDWRYDIDEVTENIYITPLSEVWRIAAMKLIFERRDLAGPTSEHSQDDFYEAVGGLLGYRSVDIETFLTRCRAIDSLVEDDGLEIPSGELIAASLKKITALYLEMRGEGFTETTLSINGSLFKEPDKTVVQLEFVETDEMAYFHIHPLDPRVEAPGILPKIILQALEFIEIEHSKLVLKNNNRLH